MLFISSVLMMLVTTIFPLVGETENFNTLYHNNKPLCKADVEDTTLLPQIAETQRAHSYAPFAFLP